MINTGIKHFLISAGIIAAFFAFIVALSLICMSQVQAAERNDSQKKLITIHDRGEEKVILTNATTVRAALQDAKTILDSNDTVEPALSDELIDSSYYINIYRARPVIVADGAVRQKIMTPYQTAEQIATDAGVTLHDQDKAILKPAEDIVSEGAGLELRIDRATPFTLVLYGKKMAAYTQAATVAGMLKEKKITIGSVDHISVPLDTSVVAGMVVALSRDGKQTITEDQDIPFPSEKIYDLARPVGYTAVQSAGALGKRMVTYEIEMQDGRETSRKQIQNVVTLEPKKQIEVVGLNPGNGLSRSKGANMFKDSKGVTHRETYYDLPMNVVMQSCGAGGHYTVRPDGAKIDKDGYILIAAHLGRYPRCSIVETSMGLGRVYDTGGFVAKHPDGFDLATDWTNNDSR